MDSSTKTFRKQADDLYARGVAAARGGQRTVAARLLRQSVRLNPAHEQAWLWLSGVLDDPEDVAFCLRAVLQLNPGNERAQRGLEHLATALPSPAAKRAVSGNILRDPDPPQPFWGTWREARSIWRSTFRLLLLIPSLLLLLTFTARYLIETQPLPERAITYRDLPTAAARPTAPPEPTVPPTPLPVNPAQITAYFTNVRLIQSRLHDATNRYRTTTEHSNTDVERAAAARSLREAIANERTTMLSLSAPQGLEPAHAMYIDGIQQEQKALDDLLAFYSKYDPALANRAGLTLQDARARIDESKRRLDAYARQFNSESVR
ncbi:MAG: hypothetical protein NVS4B8_22090 [Herpetosiphon sp.]